MAARSQMTVMSQSLKFPVSFTSPWNTSLVLRVALGAVWLAHNQVLRAQSRPSGPLFLLLVFTFSSTIRHKLFMAKLLLTMFMQCLVQWHTFSAVASGHSCNTNNHNDKNNNITAGYAFPTGHTLPVCVSCPTEFRSLYFTLQAPGHCQGPLTL